MKKPLGRKSYGSIPHLSGSRLGPTDRHCHEGQERIATRKLRNKFDRIYVQEKLDGSNCAIARINGEIVPLTRAGYHANTSPFEQHHMFATWVLRQPDRWLAILEDGQRLVGEWCAQAHGTRYVLRYDEPFFGFDLMRGADRAPFEQVLHQCYAAGIKAPHCVATQPVTPEKGMQLLLEAHRHPTCTIPEGLVYRVEHHGPKKTQVDFLVKWVRPDKEDGHLLPEMSGGPAVWNVHKEDYPSNFEEERIAV